MNPSAMRNEPADFPGKVDLWLPIMLGLEMVFITILIAAVTLTTGDADARAEGWLALAITLALNLLTFGLLYGMRTEVSADAVSIYIGPIRAKRIPLADIVSVEPKRGLSSTHLSFAATSERVQINYRDDDREKAVLVGPRDLSGFLKCLAQHAPQLTVQDRKLVRAAEAPDAATLHSPAEATPVRR